LYTVLHVDAILVISVSVSIVIINIDIIFIKLPCYFLLYYIIYILKVSLMKMLIN